MSGTELSVAMRLGVTPVPIPNTMVKTQAADGTTLETVWESRWPPAYLKKKHHKDDHIEDHGSPAIRSHERRFMELND